VKKIVLTSSGFARNPILLDKFIEFANKQPQDIKILFVSAYPFIDTEDDSIFYYDPKNIFIRERNGLIKQGFKTKNLSNHFLDAKWKGNIMDFNAIYVNGGDVKTYIEGITKDSFKDQIDELINNGGIYAGISAGSRLALAYSPVLLGYADCEIDVHCPNAFPTGPVDRSTKDVIALGEGQALYIAGDEWTVLG